jgi:hypothetical protein
MKSLLEVGYLIGLASLLCGSVGAEDETRYSCDKVQTGMTQDDVLNVLGFPSDRKSESPLDKRRSFDSRRPFDSRGTIERWSYNRYGKLPLNIVFIDGKVTSCQD